MKNTKNFLICFFYLLLNFLMLNIGVFADNNIYGFDFEVQSQAVYFVNEDTGTLIYEKNKDEKLPAAALVKNMTVILILTLLEESGEDMNQFFNQQVTATGDIFDRLYGKKASCVDIRRGEEVSIIDLLHASIMASACEATMMLVKYVTTTYPEIFGANIDEFVDLMNSKKIREKIGFKNTHFVDPDGLDDSIDQYTTAYDTYLITKYCLKNPTFEKIATTNVYDMAETEKHKQPRRIIHSNYMTSLGGIYKRYFDKRVKGIKTGAYDDKFNLVSLAKDDAYKYILVILGAPKTATENVAFIESNKFYDFAFDKLKIKTVAVPGEKVIPNNVKVDLGKGTDHIDLTTNETVSIILNKDIDGSTVFFDSSRLPLQITAPINKGTIIGQVDLKLAGKVIATVDAVAHEDIKLDLVAFLYMCTLKVFKYLWIVVVIVIVLLLILWYISRQSFINKQKRIKRNIKFKKYDKKKPGKDRYR